MLPEIGSNFWLDPEENYLPQKNISLSDLGMTGTDEVFLSTGRAAEGLVLDEIERKNPEVKKTAVVPPYTCHTVLEPLYARGYTVYAYPVDDDLRTLPDDLDRILREKEPGIVLMHRFFGFDTLEGCQPVIDHYNERETIFIEDRTQSLFSEHEPFHVDYHIGSLRKWTGMPDGGFAVCREGGFCNKPSEYDLALTEMKVKASAAKYEYLFHNVGSKDDFLKMYSLAEQILDMEERLYKISPVSEAVFLSLDLQECRNRRRDNYSILYNSLKTSERIRPILGELDDESVPLYCPIYANERAALQSALREERIYAPIVWPKSETMPDICQSASELYQHLLCIPVDQRYSGDDMERIVDCIKRNLK